MNAIVLERKARKPVKVLIVDDHRVVCEGLAYLLGHQGDFVVTECVGSSEATLASLKRDPPDIAVVDITLGNMSGLDLIKTLNQEFPWVLLLALSMHDESLYAERCLRAGAKGYIMKSEGHEKIIEGLHQVLAGKTYVSETMRDHLWQQAVNYPKAACQQPEDRLTDRELEVYTLIGQGMSTQEIAEGLQVSPKTIQTYRNNIKEKLGIETAPELIHRAVVWHTEHHRASASLSSPPVNNFG
jgi:DNA-binding NarL/FixJ family response regulator